jgi:hypothetical protein
MATDKKTTVSPLAPQVFTICDLCKVEANILQIASTCPSKE